MIAIEENSEGLIAASRRFFDTLLGIIHNRIELLGIELKEEKTRLISVLVWGIAGVFLAVITVIMLTLTIVSLFPEDNLPLALGVCTLVYLVATIASFLIAKKRIKNPTPFEETVNQLKKDRAWLKARQ